MRLTIQHTVSASLFIICWENLEISQRRTLQHTVGCVAIDHLLRKLENLVATHHKRTIQDARLLDLSEII